MSRTEGFEVMDVSTGIVDEPKLKKLHRTNPDHVPAAFMAYVGVMAESWRHGRRVPIEDGWPALLPYDRDVVESMQSVGLLDKRGYVPVKSWATWFEPARKRRDVARERWRRANVKRNEDAAREPRGNSADTEAIPSVPSDQRVNETPTGRNGAGPRLVHPTGTDA